MFLAEIFENFHFLCGTFYDFREGLWVFSIGKSPSYDIIVDECKKFGIDLSVIDSEFFVPLLRLINDVGISFVFVFNIR